MTEPNKPPTDMTAGVATGSLEISSLIWTGNPRKRTVMGLYCMTLGASVSVPTDRFPLGIQASHSAALFRFWSTNFPEVVASFD